MSIFSAKVLAQERAQIGRVDNMGGNIEGNYIAEGMGKNYGYNHDDNENGSKSDNYESSDILGPVTYAGDMPLDLEAPMAPLPIGVDGSIYNHDNNVNTTSTIANAANEESVSMEIIKEFDRDYMKLRGRLINLIEKQSSASSASESR